MKKGDVGMAKRFSKSTETGDELQLPAILCQGACQRLMLHPYITAQEPSSILYYLMLNSGIGH